jgi:hypothetical protein
LSPPLSPAVQSYGPSTHDSNCRCPRCAGYQPGNQYAVGNRSTLSHGAKKREHTMARDPRTREVVDEIREVVPVWHPSDEFVIEALGIVLVRIERAQAALEELDTKLEAEGKGPLAVYLEEGDVYDRLRNDLRRWLALAEKYMGSLGMTPGSRARLGLDIVRARRYTVLDLHEEAADEEELPLAVAG